MWQAYIFEAKGIQSYIFAGGRLRHMVGGSHIVDALCTPPPNCGFSAAAASSSSANDLSNTLSAALAAAGLNPASDPVHFTRCAGGVFSLVAQGQEFCKKLDDFQTLWTLCVLNLAPGLGFVDAMGQGQSAIEALGDARRKTAGRRSFPSLSLPEAPPPARRAPRTGLAAVAFSPIDKDDLDEALVQKEKYRDKASVTRAFSPPSSAGVGWPSNMETEFPFFNRDENQLIAVFHADGNRMGELVKRLSDELQGKTDDLQAIQRLREFSIKAEAVARAAANKASAVLWQAAGLEPDGSNGDNSKLAKFFPARPILLAGDDITIVLRADVALEFAETFLSAFEAAAAQEFDGFFGDDSTTLTACGGLAFARANQPFSQLSTLAESLCKYAKTQAKSFAQHATSKVPSCLTYHMVDGAWIAEYDAILEQSLVCRDGSGRQLSAQPYLVGASAKDDIALPRLSDMRALAQIMRSPNGPGFGTMRRIASALYDGSGAADTIFERIDAVMRARPASDKKAWEDFQTGFTTILQTMQGHKDGRFFMTQEKTVGSLSKTPFIDAVVLAQLMRRIDLGGDETVDETQSMSEEESVHAAG